MLDKEDQFIEAAKAGDAQSFRALYDHYIDPIFRFVYLKTNNREEAEDITHEVFLSSWQSLPSYVSRGLPFSSWLYRIARNKVIDHYRTRKVTLNLESVDENLMRLVGSSEESVNRTLDIERVKRSLGRLSPDQKDVTIMRFIEDMSHAEIAIVLGKSEGAVRLIQHRAVEALKDLLNNDKDEISKTTSV